MDKKELKIIKLLDKASGYAGKMQDCLDDALEVALSDKGLTKKGKVSSFRFVCDRWRRSCRAC